MNGNRSSGGGMGNDFETMATPPSVAISNDVDYMLAITEASVVSYALAYHIAIDLRAARSFGQRAIICIRELDRQVSGLHSLFRIEESQILLLQDLVSSAWTLQDELGFDYEYCIKALESGNIQGFEGLFPKVQKCLPTFLDNESAFGSLVISLALLDNPKSINMTIHVALRTWMRLTITDTIPPFVQLIAKYEQDIESHDVVLETILNQMEREATHAKPIDYNLFAEVYERLMSQSWGILEDCTKGFNYRLIHRWRKKQPYLIQLTQENKTGNTLSKMTDDLSNDSPGFNFTLDYRNNFSYLQHGVYLESIIARASDCPTGWGNFGDYYFNSNDGEERKQDLTEDQKRDIELSLWKCDEVVRLIRDLMFCALQSNLNVDDETFTNTETQKRTIVIQNEEVATRHRSCVPLPWVVGELIVQLITIVRPFQIQLCDRLQIERSELEYKLFACAKETNSIGCQTSKKIMKQLTQASYPIELLFHVCSKRPGIFARTENTYAKRAFQESADYYLLRPDDFANLQQLKLAETKAQAQPASTEAAPVALNAPTAPAAERSLKDIIDKRSKSHTPPASAMELDFHNSDSAQPGKTIFIDWAHSYNNDVKTDLWDPRYDFTKYGPARFLELLIPPNPDPRAMKFAALYRELNSIVGPRLLFEKKLPEIKTVMMSILSGTHNIVVSNLYHKEDVFWLAAYSCIDKLSSTFVIVPSLEYQEQFLRYVRKRSSIGRLGEFMASSHMDAAVLSLQAPSDIRNLSGIISSLSAQKVRTTICIVQPALAYLHDTAELKALLELVRNNRKSQLLFVGTYLPIYAETRLLNMDTSRSLESVRLFKGYFAPRNIKLQAKYDLSPTKMNSIVCQLVKRWYSDTKNDNSETVHKGMIFVSSDQSRGHLMEVLKGLKLFINFENSRKMPLTAPSSNNVELSVMGPSNYFIRPYSGAEFIVFYDYKGSMNYLLAAVDAASNVHGSITCLLKTTRSRYFETNQTLETSMYVKYVRSTVCRRLSLGFLSGTMQKWGCDEDSTLVRCDICEGFSPSHSQSPLSDRPLSDSANNLSKRLQVAATTTDRTVVAKPSTDTSVKGEQGKNANGIDSNDDSDSSDSNTSIAHIQGSSRQIVTPSIFVGILHKNVCFSCLKTYPLSHADHDCGGGPDLATILNKSASSIPGSCLLYLNRLTFEKSAIASRNICHMCGFNRTKARVRAAHNLTSGRCTCHQTIRPAAKMVLAVIYIKITSSNMHKFTTSTDVRVRARWAAAETVAEEALELIRKNSLMRTILFCEHSQVISQCISHLNKQKAGKSNIPILTKFAVDYISELEKRSVLQLD